MISGKVLALDIGHRYIHMAEGKIGKKQMDISKYAIVETPEGSVKEGAIADNLSLKNAIVTALKTNGFKNDRVIITIKSPQIIVRDFSMPVVKPEEYRSMIHLEMEQYVPSLATDYTLGFVLQDKPAGFAQDMLMIKAYAMPKRLISEYNELLKGAGLKPVVIDAHVNTASKLAKKVFFPNGPESSSVNWRTAALIDFGYEYTDLNIMSAGKSVFNRLISNGSRMLWSEVARNNNLSLKQAEAIVAKEVDLKNVNGDKIQETVRSYSTKLLADIQTNLQFYIGRNQEKKPDIMFIYGGFSRLSGFTELISSTFNVPVYCFDDIPVISQKIKNKEKPIDYVQFINVLGAFIRND